MSKTIGKFKGITNRESTLSLVDGGDATGGISFAGGGGFFKPTSSPTGTSTTLTNADSGKVIFMDASSANTVTLPAISTVAAGWNIKVILTATGNTGIIQTGNSLEDTMLGQVTKIDADGDAIVVQNDAHANTITFVNACLAGAVVDIVSNGTMFYVNGFGTHASAANKLTLTDE